MIPARLLSFVISVALIGVLAVVGVVGYRLTRAQVSAEVYRQRLVELNDQYEALRTTYNEAVRRTAVTELIVAEGRISVRIRTVEGEDRLIPTPFDPAREIYVDYVVVDGRLWIRRVFDDRTAPDQAVVIDPSLLHVDWDSPHVAHGKAAYRRLAEGRWVVTVTGDGSLGLTQRTGEAELVLSPPPSVRDYEQVEAEARRRADEVGIGEVLRHMSGF